MLQNPEYVKSKYNLAMLREIENLVAEAVQVNVAVLQPDYVGILYPASGNSSDSLLAAGTARSLTRPASTAKAILNNPSTYEILKPEDFGLTRYVSIGCVQKHFTPRARR